MPQRSHLSLNMGAAGDIGDLVFSKGQSTSHSCVSSHLRPQNSEGPGQPPRCTQPLGSPQSGPAQYPPPHCSPSARVSGRGAALPSAGHAGAQPSLLPWSLLVLLPRIRVLITGVLEPPGAVPQPISFGGLGWSCHLHPLCRCPVRGGGGSKAAVCSAWGLNPENCSQVTTSCFVLLQRGSSTGCGPGQGWGLEPLEISPGVHFPRRPGLWAQRWGITVPLKVQIQGQVGAALGEI